MTTYTAEDLGTRVDGAKLRTWMSEVHLGDYVDDVLWVDVDWTGSVTLHIADKDESDFRFRGRDGEVAMLPAVTVSCGLPLSWMIQDAE